SRRISPQRCARRSRAECPVRTLWKEHVLFVCAENDAGTKDQSGVLLGHSRFGSRPTDAARNSVRLDPGRVRRGLEMQRGMERSRRRFRTHQHGLRALGVAAIALVLAVPAFAFQGASPWENAV